MVAKLQDIVGTLHQELKPWLFNDYAPNGLQVEGKQEISSLITGVTACEALLDKAIEEKADAVLVHHGYFWKGESPCIVGMKKRRLKKLLAHDISLIGYHLPLDAHPVHGNNIQLAKLLGINITGGLEPSTQNSVGNIGELAEPCSLDEFEKLIADKLNREPLSIQGHGHPIKKVALCTGGAQDWIEYAVEKGADVFISGEISERTVHIAKENKINYIAAGHHATERYGVQALAKWLQTKHQFEHRYIEIYNPV